MDQFNLESLHPADAADPARIAHEVNRVICEHLGDPVAPPWESAPDYMKQSSIKGVQAIYANPAITPEEQHNLWMQQRLADGWTYGEVKDEHAKTHPNLVQYDELPTGQQLKDKLFQAVTRAALDM